MPVSSCRLLDRNIVQQQTGTSDDPSGTPAIRFRHPTVGDGAGVWELVRQCGVLDVNSCYAYLLICRDFSATSLLATEQDGLSGDDRLLGFVTAYRPPARPNVLFVWQIGVSPAARKRGIARSLIRELLASEACHGIDCVEATIAPSNRASRRLFQSLAGELRGEVRVVPGFTAADFGSASHDPEETVRIELPKNLKGIAMKTFERMESEVRGYCRSFPTVFTKATGHTLVDEKGRHYIDFFAGAGALNYGHNHPVLRDRLVDYIASDNITHSLDLATVAKRNFLETFEEVVLKPRNMEYKIMFPGPTGTNAVEAALKLARKVTGRTNVIGFTNGFHGMTLGSLALTGNGGKRAGAGVALSNATHMPFCGYFGTDTDTLEMLHDYVLDTSSGIDAPAAIVLETVQAEGGVNVASRSWLARLAELANQVGALLIVDDIQVGCGRTGPFFSFEPAGISPDIICLSKSLSGYGLPMAITMMKPEHDQWNPGEHNGTFRGHNPAFVTATAALETFWTTNDLAKKVNRDAARLRDTMLSIAEDCDADVRGRGLIQGIEFKDHSLAGKISQEAFQRGLIIETAGRNDEVLKALPPLTIDDAGLQEGLEIMEASARTVLGRSGIGRPAPADCAPSN